MYWLNIWYSPRYPNAPCSVERHDTEDKAREEVFEHFDGRGYDRFFYVETIVVDGRFARVVSFEDDALREVIKENARRRQDDALPSYVRAGQ